LLRRGHSSAANLTPAGEFSARIEHAGVSHYFPLGTLSEDFAAARAREIYLAVVRDGWELANQRFHRELTVALHWADNPIAWTYATFHTAIHIGPLSPPHFPGRSARPVNVALVESDFGARLALSQCVNGQSGFVCSAAFENGKDALRDIPRCSPNLALVSRALPDMAPEDLTERLRRIAPNLPVLFFNLYEDSDHLFKATPGGASGYLLKRTPPDRLFEPIAEALGVETLTQERIAQHVRRYFHDVIVSLSADDAAREMAKLTHREHEILNLLSKGYVDKEIAEALGISVWTVHGHLKKVFEKLGVHTRTEAAIKYLHK
jgi:DNA-binding NarL/FixJ family response regulator